MSIPKPEVAQTSPYPAPVEAGKTYWWCACGKSASQPFCDGSHKGGPFTPVKYVATSSGVKYFCGCKASEAKPLCDGSHNNLP